MYLIVGANGFFGNYLIKNILQHTDEEILATDVTCPVLEGKEPRLNWIKCDITKTEDIQHLNNLTQEESNLKVIYLPVFFNVNKNPANDKIAWNVNIISYAHFLDIMENMSVFYSISTDMLFKKSRETPYSEEDIPEPLNDYAKHKLIEEKMALAKGYNIVRLPVMMGTSLSPSKKHFYDEIIDTLKSGEKMEFFIDSWRSMIDFNTASETLLRLINTSEAQKYPIVNISGDEGLSKYDYALRVAEKHNLDKSLIIPLSMDSDTHIWKEKRPKKVLLDNKLAKKILNIQEIKINI